MGAGGKRGWPAAGALSRLQSGALAARIAGVQDAPKPAARPTLEPAFVPGALVLVTLNAPREKFWGVVLDISPSGVSLRGIDLNSFDDFSAIVRNGEATTPSAVFFPMHRVERMEVDVRNGEIPSLAERFESKSGRDCHALFGGAR